LNLALTAGAHARALGMRISPRHRQRILAVTGALLAHALMLSALLGLAPARQAGLGPSSEIGGQSNAFKGSALSPLLVSLAPRGDLGASSTSLPAARTQASAAGPQASAAGPQGSPARPTVVEAVDLAPAPKTGGDGAAATDSKDLQAAQADPAAAAAVQGVSPEAALQGGAVEGEQNLLRQIARCLPADRKPAIDGATLAIRLDAAGGLAAAPAMDMSLALASPETIADANRIVQAALQCGPYAPPGGSGADYALRPDFSFLKPRQVAAGAREADSRGR
jgi:hypothetical protein